MNIIENYIGNIPYLIYLKYYNEITSMQAKSGASLFECMYRYFFCRQSSYDDLTVKKQDGVCKRCGRVGWDVRWSGITRQWLCKACWNVVVKERC